MMQGVVALVLCSQIYSCEARCARFQHIDFLPCCERETDDVPSKAYQLTLPRDVGKTALPIVLLDTGNANPTCGEKVDTEIKIIYDEDGGLNRIDDEVVQRLSRKNTKIRLAGQSSRWYRKKQFNIYFEEEDGILDLPKQERLRLYAPSKDKSALKNWLIFSLDRCNGGFSPRTRFVRTFLASDDGPKDLGLYMLQEKIDRDDDTLDIDKKSCRNAPDCGYILELDRGCRDGAENNCVNLQSRRRRGTKKVESCIGSRVEIKYPGKATDEQHEFMFAYLDRVCQYALTDKLFDYIDAESFYNQFIYTQLSMNVDGFVSSEFFHKDGGGKLMAGPQWDFNGAFGFNYEDDRFEEPDFGWMRSGKRDSGPKTLRNLEDALGWELFLKNQDFVDGLICHYKDLRESTMTKHRLKKIIDAGAAFLEKEGAMDSLLDDDFEEAVDDLKKFVEARLDWMDDNIDDYALGLKGPCRARSQPSSSMIDKQCQLPDASDIIHLGGTYSVPLRRSSGQRRRRSVSSGQRRRRSVSSGRRRRSDRDLKDNSTEIARENSAFSTSVGISAVLCAGSFLV